MNELNTPNRALTLQEAAALFGTSRSRVWRAMNDGHLPAEKRRVGGRSTWTVLEQDLQKWAEEWLDESELLSERQILNNSEQVSNSSERSRTFMNEHERTRTNEAEQPRTFVSERIEHESSPPLELYLEMLDRLQRAERRSVELELQLRQSQRLLTENAESITEKEALASAARAQLQATEDSKQIEIARLAAELEAAEVARQTQLREAEEAQKIEAERHLAELEAAHQQLAEAKKPTGFFSWLGLRKKRTASGQVDKAV